MDEKELLALARRVSGVVAQLCVKQNSPFTGGKLQINKEGEVSILLYVYPNSSFEPPQLPADLNSLPIIIEERGPMQLQATVKR